MQQAATFAIRTECPPGACDCGREQLEQPGSDIRILMLTRDEEKRLIARITAVDSYDDLKKVQAQMQAKLGMVLTIAPGPNEVKTVRGLQIELADQPGLCRKTRQAVPAAVRKCLEQNLEIAYAILDAHDLFGANP
ncbi:MAG TPA: hypothetical protein VIT92_13010 [Burkholderiaceae bacterium]